jgi:hypothetical protein
MKPNGYWHLDTLDDARAQKSPFCLMFSVVIRGSPKKKRPESKNNSILVTAHLPSGPDLRDYSILQRAHLLSHPQLRYFFVEVEFLFIDPRHRRSVGRT